jgi:hypothetical protein
MRGVAERAHCGPHLGGTCRRGPCLGVGGVPGGNIVGPSLHPNVRGSGKPAQDAEARPSIERSDAIPAMRCDPLR